MKISRETIWFKYKIQSPSICVASGNLELNSLLVEATL